MREGAKENASESQGMQVGPHRCHTAFEEAVAQTIDDGGEVADAGLFIAKMSRFSSNMSEERMNREPWLGC